MSGRETGVAAVERALRIVAAFGEGDRALSLHELAARTGFYKSTILRLAASLERHGCLQRMQDGSYRLGPMLLRWGSLYLAALDVEAQITPVLARLARDTGESATFYTCQGDMRLCLARVDTYRSVRDHVNVGELLPLDKGAGGKILLAFGAPASGRRPRRPASMVIATFGERDADAAGLAAPVFGPGGGLRGALSLSGLATRFRGAAMSRFTRLLLAAAAELTSRLGGDPQLLRSKRA